MNPFYRKERPEIFNSRFNRPAPPTNAWSLKSHTIFKAKQTRKIVTIQGRRITCTVSGTSIQLTGLPQPATIQEHEFEQLLRPTNTTIKAQVAKQICKDHATSSRSSILISGCVVDNFALSTNFVGHKLCLELRTRQPFANPYSSGREKEYFLVGTVSDTDCRLIKYFGATQERLNVLVNAFGSRIPRPA